MRRHAAALIAGGVLSIADAGNGAPPAAAAPTETPDFVIEGDVHGLHPGEHTTLDAMVENPYDVDLTVTSIEVVARDAGPACPGSLLGFDASRASAVVPARSTAVVPIGIALDR